MIKIYIFLDDVSLRISKLLRNIALKQPFSYKFWDMVYSLLVQNLQQ